VGAFAGLDQSQGEVVSETETNETKREQLRRKVAESQSALARPQPSAGEPPEGYKALAMDYPFALILGGLALGAIAGAVLPRRAGRKLVQGAVAAAGIAGELGKTYGRQALDTVGEAADSVTGKSRGSLGALGEKLVELGEAVGEAAGAYGRKAADVAVETASAAGAAAGKAADKAGHLAEDGAANARETGLKIARQVIRLTSQLRH